MLKKIGVALVTLPVVVFILDKMVGVYDRVAQGLCGPAYLLEPDKNLVAQGILSETSCGFDADLTGVAGTVFVMTAGGLIYLAGRRRRLYPQL
ncbi:MAG: hypothetical protein Q7T86_06480 [Hyphomicrobiaceae bacterium]|nr:hypothetical protein [Hyphomicrobiaceae bacterium]